MTDEAPHTPLDALLGAAPRRVMRHWLSLLVLALAAVGAAAFFVRFVTGDDTPYFTAPVEQGDMIPLVSERGQVRGSGEVTVSALIDGRVTWVTGKADGEVTQGEVLAVIDAGPLADAVAIDQSRLAADEAALAAARVSADDSAARLARFESVWKRSGGRAPSLNEIERARADARRDELAVAGAAAQVRATRLQLGAGKARQAGAQVRAPITGLIVTRHVRPGQAVREGQPLFTIAAGIAPLTIEVPLTTQPEGPIRAGTLARVRLDTMPEATQAATLTLLRVSPPPQTAPPRAVFTIEKPEPGVRPGMAATVEIELPERTNVLLVPDAALSFEPGARTGARRERIYVLDEGEPRRVYVAVGGSDGKRTEVFGEGIRPGDQVITGWRDATAGAGRSGP